MTEQEIYSSAIHESGHVVAAFYHGAKFKGVTIVPDEDTLGKVSSRVDKRLLTALGNSYITPLMERNIKHLLIILMSGPAAESIYNDSPIDKYYSSDYHKCYQALTGNLFDENVAHAYLEYIIQEAFAFFKYNHQIYWNKANEIAKLLVDKKTLSYNDCELIYFSNPVKNQKP